MAAKLAETAATCATLISRRPLGVSQHFQDDARGLADTRRLRNFDILDFVVDGMP
jgi:hypothetical protein